MASKSTGFYSEDPGHIWWRPEQPTEIHVVFNDKIFTEADGTRPGLWFTASSKLKSANYSPKNFNRLARALKAKGLPAPAEVPEHDRRLTRRWKLIAKFGQ